MALLDLLFHEEVRDEEFVGDEGGDCLVCKCRPKITFCGGYVRGPISDVGWTPEECCAECVRVAESGCPACGCRAWSTCRRCDPRPWWRRWRS